MALICILLTFALEEADDEGVAAATAGEAGGVGEELELLEGHPPDDPRQRLRHLAGAVGDGDPPDRTGFDGLLLLLAFQSVQTGFGDLHALGEVGERHVAFV